MVSTIWSRNILLCAVLLTLSCGTAINKGPNTSAQVLKPVERQAVSLDSIIKGVAASVIGEVVRGLTITELKIVCDNNFFPCTRHFDRPSCCKCASACAALGRKNAALHCWYERSAPWDRSGICQN